MKRLVDELAPGFELSLLASEALDTPTEHSRNAARGAGLAALGAAAALGAGASVGAGVSAGLKGGALFVGWKAIAVGVVVGGLAVGTSVAVVQATREVAPPKPVASENDRARAEAPPAVPTPVASARSEHDEAPRHADAIVTATPSALPPAPNRADITRTTETPSRARAEAPPAARPSAPSPSDQLAAEVRTLDVVRNALQRKDASAAIRELDAYATTHPNGSLAPEAKALRVEALAMHGDRDGALGLAKELLAEHPNGPYRRRLEKELGTPIQ